VNSGTSVLCPAKPGNSCDSTPWGQKGSTGNGIADILMNGHVYGYGEAVSCTRLAGRYQDYEFYSADTWKVLAV